jgi:hypothetical protein
MISILIPILLILVVAGGTISVLLASRHFRVARVQAGSPRPFDVDAFAALLDREDELFQRARLPYAEFSRLKRRRIRVAFLYLERLSATLAAILHMRSREWLLAGNDDQVDSLASLASDLASHIRVQCLIAYAKLSIEFVFPEIRFSPAVLIMECKSLKATVVELHRIASASGLASVPAL